MKKSALSEEVCTAGKPKGVHLAGSIWVIGMISAVLFASLPTALAVDPFTGKRPPGILPAFAKVLSHFDLEIPIAEASGVVKIASVGSDPAKGFASDPGYGTFFWSTGAAQMIFLVPPDGATTPNSHFPRTELNQKKAERWKIPSGNHTLRGTFALTAMPKISDKGEITVAQIHNDVSDNGPLVKLICDYNARPWKLLADYRVEPKKSSAIIRTPDRQRESIALNGPLDYEIILSSAGVLSVKARRAGSQNWKILADSSQKGQTLEPGWESETCYFKAGCYMFDPGPAGTPPAQVNYLALSVE